MEIDIHIDSLTDCLIETATGRVLETEYMKRESEIKRKDWKKWKFDWNQTQDSGYDIYELHIKGSSTVEGRISFIIDGGVAVVDIVETAPHNYGHNGKYTGVGGHLFAIACKESMEAGCDGFVAFTAKSDLIEHYKETLGAKVLAGQKMYIDENAAQVLIKKYLKG